MIRKLLTVVIPLLAPIVAYLVWAWFTARRRDARESGQRLPGWQEWPWPWLIAAGAALVTVSLFVFGFAQDGRPGLDYRPARYEDGKLVPGTFSDGQESDGVGTDR